MSDFLHWLIHRAPDHVYVIAVAVCSLIFLVLLFLGILTLRNGAWHVPLLLWVILPGAIVYVRDQYRKDQK